MAVNPRKVKNKKNADGTRSGKAGTVYDVNIKYMVGAAHKTYNKRGFLLKAEAVQHEAEMRVKLVNPTVAFMAQSKITVKEHLNSWVVSHGTKNLRPSTYDGYKRLIDNHINPCVGHILLRDLTPAMIDDMYDLMFAKGLSQSTVRYTHRVLSVGLEAARKYGLIVANPTQNIITKFGKPVKTPDPYTAEQLKRLLDYVVGTEWFFIIVLGGLYGLRISEILGLRRSHVNLDEGELLINEQLPFGLPFDTLIINEMAPTKSYSRFLPITDITRPYFEQQFAAQDALGNSGGFVNNDLMISKTNGAPLHRENVSKEFGRLIKRSGLQHIRFHDLRHSAATNMHQLTGDFFTVGEILGHTLKGVGITLGISQNLDATTAQYVDVRVERKRTVLDVYHKAVLG